MGTMFRTVALVSAAGLIACGGPKRPSAPPQATALTAHPAVGCWSLAVDGDSGYAVVPQYFRLDSTLWLPDDTASTARVLFDSLSTGPGLRDGNSVPYWLPYPGLSDVYVAWGDGFAGKFVRLHVRFDTLEGRLWDWTDISRPHPVGRLLGHRVRCEHAPMHRAG
jgi:hypothetical protein